MATAGPAQAPGYVAPQLGASNMLTQPNGAPLANAPGQTDVPAGGTFTGAPGAPIPPRDPIYRVNPNGAPVPTPGAAPTVAPQPGTTLDPNQSYVDAFNASLARQRQAIDNQLAHSLGALGHRRDLAAATIVGGSGDIAQQYKNAGTLDQAQAATAAAAGSPDAVGGGVNAGLYKATIGTEAAGDKQATPLLQLGAQANYDSGNAMLHQQAMQGQEAIDQQQSQFLAAQAQQAATFQHDQEMAQLQAKLANPKYDPANDPTLQRAIYEQTHGMSNGTQPYTGSPQQLLDSRAQKAGLSGGAELQAIVQPTDQQGNPIPGGGPYGWAVRALQKAPGQANGKYGPTLDWMQVLNHVGPEVVAALVATNVITVAQAQAYAKATAAPPGGSNSGGTLQ